MVSLGHRTETIVEGNRTRIRKGSAFQAGAGPWAHYMEATYDTRSIPTYSTSTKTTGGERRTTNLDMTSTWGQVIPLLWGNTRTATLVCWASVPVERTKKSSVYTNKIPGYYEAAPEGIGTEPLVVPTPTAPTWTGPLFYPVDGETRTSFSYFLDGLFSVGYRGRESASYFIKKMWVDDELVYDVTTAFYKAGLQFTFYDGTQTGPDPIFKDDPQIGANFKDIRYPGMMYVLLKNIDMSSRGLRMPNVTVEMWMSSGTPTSIINYDAAPSALYNLTGINWEKRLIYVPSFEAVPYVRVFDLDTQQYLYEAGPFANATQRLQSFFYVPWINTIITQNLANSGVINFYNAETMELYRMLGRTGNSINSGVFPDGTPSIGAYRRICAVFDFISGVTYIITAGIVERSNVNVITHTFGSVDRIKVHNNLISSDVAEMCADDTRRGFYLMAPNGNIHFFNPLTGATNLFFTNPNALQTSNGMIHDPYNDILITFHRQGAGSPIIRGIRGNGTVLWTVVGQSALTTDANSSQQYLQSYLRAGTFGFGLFSNGTVLDIATGQQRKYGANHYGSRWDSVRRLFIGFSNGQLVNRTIAPFNPDDRVSLSSWLIDMGERLGYPRANVIVSDVTDTIIGAQLISNERARDLLIEVCNFYKINMIESGNILAFNKRETGDDLVPDATIDIRQDAARMGQSDDSPYLSTSRLSDRDIPVELTVWYLDREADFNSIPYLHRRAAGITSSNSEAQLRLPLVLERDHVASLASAMLYDAWAVQVTHGFRLPQKYGFLNPGDVLDISEGSFADTVRVTQMTINGDWSLTISVASIRENEDPNLVVDAIRYRDLQEGLPVGNPLSYPIIVDTPLWDFSLDAPDSVVHNVAAVSERNIGDWPGASLMYESAFTTRGLVANFRNNQIWGKVLGKLPAHAPCATDSTSILRVLMPNPTFDFTVNVASSMSLQNLCAVGRQGKWEILTFANFSWAAGIGTFTNLVRGRLGTDVYTDDHVSGETFVMLTPTLAVHLVKIATVGTAARYTAVGLGLELDEGYPLPILVNGNSKRPYEPADIRCVKTGNDLVFSWFRRDRLGILLGGWNDGGAETLPLNETDERYTLIIYDGDDVVIRTVENIVTSGYTYTQADQTTDSYVVSGTIQIKLAQISSLVGPGFSKGRFIDVQPS